MEYEVYDLRIIEAGKNTIKKAEDYLYIPKKDLAYGSDKKKVSKDRLKHIEKCFEHENMHSVISKRNLDKKSLEKLIGSLR